MPEWRVSELKRRVRRIEKVEGDTMLRYCLDRKVRRELRKSDKTNEIRGDKIEYLVRFDGN